MTQALFIWVIFIEALIEYLSTTLLHEIISSAVCFYNILKAHCVTFQGHYWHEMEYKSGSRL